MITSAFKRYLQKDCKKEFKHNPIVGNMQYSNTKSTLSPTYLYTSPFVGTVLHSKTYDYFEERLKKQQAEEQRVKKIFVELSANRDEWTKITISPS